ncbi:HECT E3 ubiquitin ligase, partial [Thraustotheca clavata]
VRLCRTAVDVLAQYGPSTPEVLDTQIDGLGIDASFTNDVEVVNAPFGLYPQPIIHLSSEIQTSVLEWFNFLGKFVAQALVDERLLDLPFALPFVRALTGESLLPDTTTALKHVSAIDPDIGRSLTFLYTHQDDASIDDMGLAFVLIGNADVELKENGADIPVTCANVKEYVTLTLEMLLNTSIAKQVSAFRKGFNTIVPESVLSYFTASEWVDLISDSSTELWPRGAEELKAFMVCDHGYTNESRAIQWLIEILVDFSPEEQRLFVRFVTGSHRLPLGGLSKLDPTLTVVKKLSPDELSNDDDMLPSASTCTNYLKLPDYTSKELMRTKLLYCIHEGQLSFHLS